MDESVITSRDNNRVRHARKVRDGKIADEIFVEGVRLCEQATTANLEITDVIHTEQIILDDRAARVLSDLGKRFTDSVTVTESVFASLSDTKTPQGIAVMATRPRTDVDYFNSTHKDVSLLVIMHRLSNPANAGAIFRVAEGVGATGVIATAGTADIFSPKALRGAMGSSFRVPAWTGTELQTALIWCRKRGVRIVCVDAHASEAYTDFDWTESCALVVGPEADGFTRDELTLSDAAVMIPMRHPVESLNVAVATGVVLYEAARQRMTP
jgi:TrmH family RNA methyltransferase